MREYFRMVKFSKNKNFVLFIILLAIFVITSEVSALELNWPNSPGGTQLTDTSTLPEMVQYFYEWGIAIGGIATFFSLVVGGFQYLTSVGHPEAMSEAKDRIQTAFFGLVLLLSVWLILDVINPDLTTFQPVSLNLSGITVPFGVCDADVDCSPGYQCTDPNPGDGTVEGICVPKTQLPPCDYAMLYDGINWTGSQTRIDEGVLTQIFPKSIESFYMEDSTFTSCGPTACGCILQLFAEQSAWWMWWSVCGDKIGDLPAYEADIERWIDRPVFCVRLVRFEEY